MFFRYVVDVILLDEKTELILELKEKSEVKTFLEFTYKIESFIKLAFLNVRITNFITGFTIRSSIRKLLVTIV